MTLESPIYLLLFGGIIAIYWWRQRHATNVTIQYPEAKKFQQLEDKKTKLLAKIITNSRYLILILMVITLAKPQLVNISKQMSTQGIDIMLLLDVSGSMSAEDLKPNRLTVAKKTISTFIKKRQNDRIGLVVFGGDAFTSCPLTLDDALLQQFLEKTKIGSAGRGTAIGLAIATGLNRVKNSVTKSKILVLLTDGENNSGEVDPITAAKTAQKMGIKIYAIGVGKKGGAPIPIYDPNYGKTYQRNPNGSLAITKLDDTTLKEIALATKGRYFRANNEDELRAIYDDINTIETSKINENKYRQVKDLFPPLLLTIFILLCCEVIVSNGMIRTIP